MPIHRSHAADLARMLNRAKQPIYVLDDERTIVFFNAACADWLGRAAEDLAGRRAAYRSSVGAGPDAAAAGLCPPPQAFSGEIVSATVAAVRQDGRTVERRARFFPLAFGEEDIAGVLAVLDVADLSPDSAVSENAGAVEPSPIDLHELVRRFRSEAAARLRADRLIGLGPVMRLARRQVELAAASRTSVLLVGPPGSGRMRLAAAIHYGETSDSAEVAPYFPPTDFVPLDCSLLGEDLFEAAGAALARAAGSLLFHRVDEFPADVQTRLAEMLTNGASRVRLMASAAESLVELARRGKFHPELAAQFSTIVIELPPLSARREDIPLLAQLILEEENTASDMQLGGFSPEALDLLAAYAWPGNLDELAGVVGEARRRAAGPLINAVDLPERVRFAVRAAATPRRAEETIVLDEFIGRVERELIRRALARSKGNKASAARLLGITRPRLYRRMVQLGLEE